MGCRGSAGMRVTGSSTMAMGASVSSRGPSFRPPTKSSPHPMMALHQVVERLLLLGAHLESLPAAPTPQAPQALQPLIEATAEAHQRFDERAIYYGHRYRSGFWAIYLLSAIAVLFAVMPLALGWDSKNRLMHPYAGLW